MNDLASDNLSVSQLGEPVGQMDARDEATQSDAGRPTQPWRSASSPSQQDFLADGVS